MKIWLPLIAFMRMRSPSSAPPDLRRDGSIEITVYDAKCRTTGAGPCTTNAQCGAGGVCTAALASVPVQIATDSDSVKLSTTAFTVLTPIKTFDLPAVPGSPGLFRGRVVVSGAIDRVEIWNADAFAGVEQRGGAGLKGA